MEMELESETKAKSDAQRNLKRYCSSCIILYMYIPSLSLYCRNDRRYKEVVSQMEEEKSNAQRLQDQVNSLNTKIRNLRRDKEEAENETEGLQRKLRQAKSALEDAEEESSTLKAQISKLRGGAASRKPKVGLMISFSLKFMFTPLSFFPSCFPLPPSLSLPSFSPSLPFSPYHSLQRMMKKIMIK